MQTLCTLEYGNTYIIRGYLSQQKLHLSYLIIVNIFRLYLKYSINLGYSIIILFGK